MVCATSPGGKKRRESGATRCGRKVRQYGGYMYLAQQGRNSVLCAAVRNVCAKPRERKVG